MGPWPWHLVPLSPLLGRATSFPSRLLSSEALSPRGALSFARCHRTLTNATVSPAGNHETDNMNQIYGFEGEVKAKYTAQMFALFSEVFEWLPLAQCINGKVLVRGHRVHPPPHLLAVPRVCGGCPCHPPLSPLSPYRCAFRPRSCTGVSSAKTASPSMTSGRSRGTGSLRTQVTDGPHVTPFRVPLPSPRDQDVPSGVDRGP